MSAPAVVAARRGGPGRPIVSAFPTTRGTRSRPTAVPSYSRSWTRTSRPRHTMRLFRLLVPVGRRSRRAAWSNVNTALATQRDL